MMEGMKMCIWCIKLPHSTLRVVCLELLLFSFNKIKHVLGVHFMYEMEKRGWGESLFYHYFCF